MTWTLEAIISTLTLVFSLSVKLIGFPNQIQKVRQAGSVRGVSILYFSLSFFTYILWTFHGILKQDRTVILGQGLGVIVSGVLVFVLFQTARKSRSNLK